MTAFRHSDVAALVLAAGQGTRMNSDLPKVLHPMAGRPLLDHVLAALRQLGVGRTLVVIGHQRERVRAAFPSPELEWVVQAEQRGTGHAVLVAGPALEDFSGTLLIVCGDTPLLRAPILHELLEGHHASGAAATVLSAKVPDPGGYGRILRVSGGAEDAIAGIVEQRDATPEQRAIDEINSGNYAFDYRALSGVLGRLTASNSQGEYYLTDTIRLLLADGRKAAVRCAPDHRELLGINTPDQLAEAERLYFQMQGSGTLPRAGS
ncbi:MAG: NTP transferase domain-containing protein [Candidatus Eisenbacteria bacterium]|uniref:NTP transferase domain-containing protein n=1 Tax=Eiseniibacteriota bacterium TaxID=2212470 RepID=A0A849SL83_UNCEI|nr:NTP transferase domain-containing protein [Candidatus Eisenbacteria bacterium]